MQASAPSDDPGRRVIDLNADLGEGITDDEALLGVVTSANVACGFHAGDAATMRFVCRIAAERGVRIGAQVSYDDRAGFGRRHLDVEPDLLARQVAEQVGLLGAIARDEGTEVTYVKPHGALYNRVVDDPEQAAAVLSGAPGLPVLGLPGGWLLRLAGEDPTGRAVFREAFPDRGYSDPDHSGLRRLLPRDQPGAVREHPEEIAGWAVHWASTGAVDSVCVHGDGPTAVAAALAVRRALEAAGWSIRPFS